MSDSSMQDRSSLRRAGRLVAVALWCGGIWLASDTPDLRVSQQDTMDLVLRKTAHVFVFGVLAVLITRAIALARRPTLVDLVAAWIATLMWAVLDEWHQSFVDGRAGQPRDVAIDAVGATIGVLVVHRMSGRPDAELEQQ